MTAITFSSRTWDRDTGSFPKPRHSGARYATWQEAVEACRDNEYSPCWCWSGDEPDPEAWFGGEPSAAVYARAA